jgi:hypothetical protein
MAWETILFHQVRSVRCAFISSALLRDNVQHHLEGGIPNGEFPTLHALADAPWAPRPAEMDPRALACELHAAWPRLEMLPIERLAISIRTRAVLTNAATRPEVRGTVLYNLVRWPVPLDLEHKKRMSDVLEPLVSDLMRLVHEIPRGHRLLVRSVACSEPQPRDTRARSFFVPQQGQR